MTIRIPVSSASDLNLNSNWLRCPYITKPQSKGQSQGMVAQDNLPKPQEKNNITKPKKDTGKRCEFHKSSTHNTSEFRAKQSLVVEMRAYESDACSDFE